MQVAVMSGRAAFWRGLRGELSQTCKDRAKWHEASYFCGEARKMGRLAGEIADF
jgi:hypothetical protein